MSGDLVSAAVAAVAVNRDRSRIYAWIREDRIASEETIDGTIMVSLADVLELEARMNKRRNNKTRR